MPATVLVMSPPGQLPPFLVGWVGSGDLVLCADSVLPQKPSKGVGVCRWVICAVGTKFELAKGLGITSIL